MRVYPRDEACGFRFTRAPWGELSNFWPLPAPITAGPWIFPTAEHLCQAAKFPARPDLQARIAAAATAKAAKALGRAPGIDPCWDTRRVDVMRWVLRRKREANPDHIDAMLARTGERPIIEVSTRDPWWGARPVGDRYEGRNALGRLWMELRRQLREDDPAAQSGAWIGRIHAGRLAGPGEPPRGG